MPSPGLYLAACALFLAADGMAHPALDAATAPAAPQPECRFTLERGAEPVADDAAETWVLTCHKIDAPVAPASHTVSLRRTPVSPLPVAN